MFPAVPVATICLLLLAGCSAGAEHPRSPAAPSIHQAAQGEEAATSREASEVAVRPTDPELIEYPERIAPTRVEVPAAGIDMDVVPVGETTNGSMELPERVDVAGWYRLSSALRSEHGNTVIAAHVDSLRYGLGPFAGLRDLDNGQIVSVMAESGEWHEYEVTSVDFYSKDQLPVDSIFTRDGARGLVLITCGGEFDSESRQYSDNIVVTATPLGT